MSKEQDMSFEREVSKFTDKYLYPKLGKPFQRFTDREHQYAGIDLQLSSTSVWKIDEKIKNSDSINEIFPYPSVEILQRNKNGDIQLGWFADESLETTHYFFLSLYSDVTDKRALREEDIQKVNVLAFQKRELKEMIECTCYLSTIVEDARAIAEESWRDRKDYYDILDKKAFHLKHSQKEGSVVLVLKREMLEKLQHSAVLEVTREGVKRA